MSAFATLRTCGCGIARRPFSGESLSFDPDGMASGVLADRLRSTRDPLERAVCEVTALYEGDGAAESVALQALVADDVIPREVADGLPGFRARYEWGWAVGKW